MVGSTKSTIVEVESEPRAAGQDGLSSQNLVPQERFIESDIQFNNPPVVPPNMLSEFPVETPQHGFAVEIGQMSEPGPSRHATQVQQDELLAQTNTFLNGLENTQKPGTPNMSKPPRVPPVVSFDETHPQDVKVRRNPNRNVRKPVPQRGHALSPHCPCGPTCSC